MGCGESRSRNWGKAERHPDLGSEMQVTQGSGHGAECLRLACLVLAIGLKAQTAKACVPAVVLRTHMAKVGCPG